MNEPLDDALVQAAQAGVVMVAADYDGALAPIVDDPDQAVPHEPAMAALARLARLPDVHVAVISGRSLQVLGRLTGKPDHMTLIGTHGVEWDDPAGDDVDPDVAAVTQAPEQVVSRHEGTLLEVKPRGAALHYRHAADPTAAAAAARTVGEGHGARIIEGKMVVEVLVGDGDKGRAVGRLRRLHGADAVVYVGDDVTDEDVFTVLQPGDVGIKVGAGDTAAEFRVDGPEDVAALLARLGDLRGR